MQLKYRIFHVFIAIILGITGIIALVVLQLLGTEPERHPVLIPNAANQVAEINIMQLAEDEVYTLLFEAKDEGFYNNLKTLTDQRLEKQQEYGNLTIDFTQPVLIISAEDDGKTFTGFLFSIQNEAVFRKNINKYLNSEQAASVREHTALVLTDPSGKTVAKILQQKADNFLKNSKKTNLSPPKDGTLLTIHSETRKNPVTLFHQRDLLGVSGEWITKNKVNPLLYTLKNKGLLITANAIPASFSDTLSKLIPGINDLKLPAINALVADYQGLYIASDDNGKMIPQPKINLVLRLDSAFSVQQFLQTVPENMRGNNNQLLLGETTYELKQLDAKTLFIGLDINSLQKTTSSKILFEVKGSLRPLLDIKGTGMIVSFLDVIPAVGAGRQFASKVKDVHLLVKQRGNRAVIQGEMRFQKGAYALHETLKLALMLNP